MAIRLIQLKNGIRMCKRIFNVMKITLKTSDATHGIFELKGLKHSDLTERLRNQVEKYRRETRVYEVD